MKNFLKYTLVLLILLAGFSFTACQNQKAIQVEAFKTTMEKNGFKVTEITATAGTGVIKAYKAEKSDSSGKALYNIRFYVYNSADTAKTTFTQAKDSFAQYEDSDSVIKNVDQKNLQRYTLLGQGYYTLITRIGDTLLFTDSPDTYKEEIIDIAKDFGYQKGAIS